MRRKIAKKRQETIYKQAQMRKDFIELLSIVGLIIVLALIIGACVYWAMDYKGLI